MGKNGELRMENGEWRNYELIETALENLNNKNYLLNSPLGGARGQQWRVEKKLRITNLGLESPLRVL